MRHVSFAAFALLTAAGCARTIDPASHTGPDGVYKGAHAIELEANAGVATGIVTYPGGDRVDWKQIDLPEGSQGALSLDLSWRAPRPGLDLAFEVYDQWGERLGRVDARAWNARRRSARRATGHKSLTITGAKGKIYVSVFASTRGDAGRYKLSATFVPDVVAYDPKFDEVLQAGLAAGTIQIPMPPKLGVVFARCGDEYDRSNPDCVENPPPCDRAHPDKANPSCKQLCDQEHLDPKLPDCIQFYKCTPETWQDPAINPACADVEPPPPPPPAEPIAARILNPEIKDGKVWISIAIAKDSPVAKGWTGAVIDRSTKKPHKNGAFKIIKVTKGIAYATVPMKLDDVNRNLDVVLYPPEAGPTN